MTGGTPSAAWVYNQTIKLFAAGAEPAFEDPSEQARTWGQTWGIDNDVGRIRSILMHRPGQEMAVIDPAKRIPEIGSLGDLEQGWYFQSDTAPDIEGMRAEHDAFVAALRAEGVEVHFLEGVTGGRLKSVYTRDPVIMVKGGAIVCRMGARIRRGEELVITRTLAKLGVPILRTLSGTAIMEGGSFSWINPQTCVIGCGVRVNREGAAQVGEVLARQGVELLVIDLVGYDIHIDGSFMMIDRDLALVDPTGLPYAFLEQLKALKVRTIEIEPADDKWIINSMCVAPGKLIMPQGATNRTLDTLAKAGVSWVTLPFSKVQANGGGLHCSTTPLVRDSI